VGGVEEAFRAQAWVQKGAGKALCSEIAEGDFRRAIFTLILDYVRKIRWILVQDPFLYENQHA